MMTKTKPRSVCRFMVARSPEFFEGERRTLGVIVGFARAALRVGDEADGPVARDPALGDEGGGPRGRRLARDLEADVPLRGDRILARHPLPLEPEEAEDVLARRPVVGIGAVR